MTANKSLACWSIALLVFGASPAQAVLVDFQDLGPATYNVGGTFNSGGVQFGVVAYNGPGTTFFVNESATNTTLFGGNSIGVEIAVPPNTNYLAFDFDDSCTPCSATGITVNGAASSPLVQLVDLNNTSLGGVQVSVLPAVTPFFDGRIVLQGPISSFSTGGTEYGIDYLEMRVPEPTCTSIALIAIGAAGLWRCRRVADGAA
jgi:hypothetical protein